MCFIRFRNLDGSLLAILTQVLSEAERKNWNCLSPAMRGEFSNFSKASLELFKNGQTSERGILIGYCDSIPALPAKKQAA